MSVQIISAETYAIRPPKCPPSLGRRRLVELLRSTFEKSAQFVPVLELETVGSRLIGRIGALPAAVQLPAEQASIESEAAEEAR